MFIIKPTRSVVFAENALRPIAPACYTKPVVSAVKADNDIIVRVEPAKPLKASKNAPQNDTEAVIRAVAKQYGVSGDTLVRVAKCESGLRHEGVWGDQSSNDQNITTEQVFEGLTHKTLIKCLAWHESGWRSNAVGDQGKSFGILQFFRPYSANSLWQKECAQRGYTDVWNPRQQCLCVDEILSSNLSMVKHWTTMEKCISN